MRQTVLRLSILAAISTSLIGCASAPSNTSLAPATASSVTAAKAGPLVNVTLSGIVGAGDAKATLTLFDAQGTRKTVTTSAIGGYTLPVSGLVAPLMLVADVAGKQYVSIVVAPSGAATANVNALTDLVASDLAHEAKLRSPAALAALAKAPTVTPDQVKAMDRKLQPLIGAALKEAKVANAENFDPVTNTSAGVIDILKVIHHNRGYDSKAGTPGESSIFDSTYHEISRFSPLNLAKAQAEQQGIAAPGVVRIFIAGDSTASNYDVDVFPRTGWGQVFDRQIKEGHKVKVVNVAQSGRSSRSFINEGWFNMIAADIRKGDYLLVQFGHNDEKCGNEPPAPPPSRDTIDIANLCTYPGSAAGIPAEFSFQKNLEKYIALAKSVGATPVLITPVTRRNFKGGIIASTTHTYGKGKFPGNYSQTVRDTAAANGVALVDLDARSMAFFNKVGEADSLNYYLAVDTAKYPYYINQTGRHDKPDNTHMQEKGAETMGGLIAQGIKDANLPLASDLK
jgi:lysophospholipase L1-like esterase